MNSLSNIARRSDPASSHASGKEITDSGARKYQIDKVLEAVMLYPGKTSKELSALVIVGRNATESRFNFGRRLSELERSGLVRREDTHSREGVRWWPVTEGQQKLF